MTVLSPVQEEDSTVKIPVFVEFKYQHSVVHNSPFLLYFVYEIFYVFTDIDSQILYKIL
jgi:hypothetical protein